MSVLQWQQESSTSLVIRRFDFGEYSELETRTCSTPHRAEFFQKQPRKQVRETVR